MQADLFNLSMSNSFERQAFQKSFFEKKYTLRLDQLLGFGLVAIVFFVLVFAWGAEHGKAVSRREFMLHHAQSLAEKATQAEAIAPQKAVIEPVAAVAMPAASVEVAQENRSEVSVPAAPAAATVNSVSVPTTGIKPKYTIAHMTYVKKEQAMIEIERIKSKGFTPFLVSSGRYYQICVNGFESRKSANEMIKALRMKGIVSSDSYIRNMPAIS